MLSSNHTYLQRKGMRIIYFSDFNEHTTSLFSKAKVFLLINLYQVLTTNTTLDVHQMVF